MAISQIGSTSIDNISSTRTKTFTIGTGAAVGDLFLIAHLGQYDDTFVAADMTLIADVDFSGGSGFAALQAQVWGRVLDSGDITQSTARIRAQAGDAPNHGGAAITLRDTAATAGDPTAWIDSAATTQFDASNLVATAPDITNTDANAWLLRLFGGRLTSSVAGTLSGSDTVEWQNQNSNFEGALTSRILSSVAAQGSETLTTDNFANSAIGVSVTVAPLDTGPDPIADSGTLSGEELTLSSTDTKTLSDSGSVADALVMSVMDTKTLNDSGSVADALVKTAALPRDDFIQPKIFFAERVPPLVVPTTHGCFAMDTAFGSNGGIDHVSIPNRANFTTDGTEDIKLQTRLSLPWETIRGGLNSNAMDILNVANSYNITLQGSDAGWVIDFTARFFDDTQQSASVFFDLSADQYETVGVQVELDGTTGQLDISTANALHETKLDDATWILKSSTDQSVLLAKLWKVPTNNPAIVGQGLISSEVIADDRRICYLLENTLTYDTVEIYHFNGDQLTSDTDITVPDEVDPTDDFSLINQTGPVLGRAYPDGHWSDITTDLRFNQGVRFSRGRDRDLEDIASGSASFVLNNLTGDFTPNNARGKYGNNIQPLCHVKIEAEYQPEGPERLIPWPIWQGYVKDWTPDEELTSKDAVTRVNCIDLLAIIQEQRIRPVQDVINELNPDGYWPLDETSGSTFADVSGNGNDATITGSPTFDDDTFSFGQAIKHPEFTNPTPAASPGGDATMYATTGTIAALDNYAGVMTVCGWIRSDLLVSEGLNFSHCIINISPTSSSNSGHMLLSVAEKGPDAGSIQAFGRLGTGASDDGKPSAGDPNGWHFVAMTRNPTVNTDEFDLLIYLDELEEPGLTTTYTGVGSITGHTVKIAASETSTAFANGQTGHLAHVAFWKRLLSAGELRRIFRAQFDTAPGELAGIRVGKVLDTIGVPADMRSVDTGTVTLPAIATNTGANSHMQKIAFSELGIVGVLADGKIAFEDGQDLATRTAVRTLNDADPIPEAYLQLPEVNFNYFSTPDSGLNSITGDIDVRFSVRSQDWTDGSQTVISQYDSQGDDRGYAVLIKPDGKLGLDWTEDGTLSTLKTHQTTDSIDTKFADGELAFARVTMDVDNGSSQRVITFYTSADRGETWDIWEQITPAATSTTSIFDSTAPVRIGSRDGGANHLSSARFGWVEVYDGIDGTLAVNFQASEAPIVAGSWVASTTGATWTWTGGLDQPLRVNVGVTDGKYQTFTTSAPRHRLLTQIDVTGDNYVGVFEDIDQIHRFGIIPKRFTVLLDATQAQDWGDLVISRRSNVELIIDEVTVQPVATDNGFETVLETELGDRLTVRRTTVGSGDNIEQDGRVEHISGFFTPKYAEWTLRLSDGSRLNDWVNSP